MALLALVAAGCGPDLPEPEAPGARVLQARCGGCHRVFPPASMTFAMWKLQVERMRPRFAERGVPWLTSPEEQSLLDYLARHAGGS